MYRVGNERSLSIDISSDDTLPSPTEPPSLSNSSIKGYTECCEFECEGFNVKPAVCTIKEVSFLSAISIVSSVIVISLALLGAPVLLANIFESFVFVFLGFLGVIMLIYEYNEVRHCQIHTIHCLNVTPHIT